jgi:hypothetical protein
MGTVSDRQAQLDCALGYMVRRAAMTEFFLQQTIKELIRSRYAPLVTASLPATAALDAIQRIVDVGNFGNEASWEFKRIADIARVAFGERNKYVHGIRIAVEGQDVLLIRNRKKGGFDRFMAEVDGLGQLGEEFGQLSAMIVEWKRNHVEGKSKAVPFEIDDL